MAYSFRSTSPIPHIEPSVQRLVKMARHENVPGVGLFETEPVGASYQQWMTTQVEALHKALPDAPQ